TGGTLINKSGHVFHVTNTNAVINLDGVTIEDSGAGVVLSVCDDGWSGANNQATLNLSGQDLDGTILVGDDATLTLNIADASTFRGNISGAITNAQGTTVSTEIGTVNVTLDDTSKWYLDGDTHIASFSGTAANVITNGYTLYVDDVALDGTTESDGSGSGDDADADAVPAWFDADLYMENKLEQLGDGWDAQSVRKAFDDAGYSGDEGCYRHFLDFGNRENVSPNKYFDSDDYFQSKLTQLQRDLPGESWTLESVQQAFENANLSTWDHYGQYGMSEGVDPCDSFSTSAYFKAKLDALQRDDPAGNWTMESMIAAFQQAGLNPVQHYMLYGVHENLDFAPDDEDAVSVALVAEGYA
ncbi:MAG: hypothetical protein IJU65_06045, partial [Desulfovibrio sp.]|nr:hypothetical protein [Desulfovibrio sp.]